MANEENAKPKVVPAPTAAAPANPLTQKVDPAIAVVGYVKEALDEIRGLAKNRDETVEKRTAARFFVGLLVVLTVVSILFLSVAGSIGSSSVPLDTTRYGIGIVADVVVLAILGEIWRRLYRYE